MIKIENLVTPSADWFNVAIKGMRNSYKSGGESDSSSVHGLSFDFIKNPLFTLGETDKRLLLKLCKAGTSHRKVLRQLPVIMDITAPLYWWKQMDQYKLGTVTNSESTMHTLANKPFEPSDFSLGDLAEEDYYIESGWLGIDLNNHVPSIFDMLNHLRDRFLETKDPDYWNAINQLLPQSYNQKRTWSANYETLVNIIQQRKGHTLKEWDDFIDYLLEHVPYLKEIVEAIDE